MAPATITFVSIGIAYALNACAFVIQDLACAPYNKPAWAFRPTVGVIVLMAITWPARFTLNYMAMPDCTVPRAVAFGVMAFLIQMSAVTLFIAGCLVAVGHVVEDWRLQLIIAAASALVTSLVALPLLNVAMMPVTLLLSWPLDLLFPLKPHSRND